VPAGVFAGTDRLDTDEFLGSTLMKKSLPIEPCRLEATLEAAELGE
jgi:hypothetical protein